MFIILAKIPKYNDNDAFCGYLVRRASPNTYETAALAFRMMPSEYDDEGQCTEVSYYVADAADPFRRPICRPLSASAALIANEDLIY